MHLAIGVLTVVASMKWADWKQWRRYHASMFFIACGGLLYEYMVKEHSLWKFHPDFLYGQSMTVIVYALITMPVSVLIFLSHCPEKWPRRVHYILLWSLIYIVVEWILYVSGRISYQNGWSLWYSFLFDIVMFSIIALHQFYPFRAYIFSILIISFLMLHFHIPFQ